jgi:hypothetical protein
MIEMNQSGVRSPESKAAGAEACGSGGVRENAADPTFFGLPRSHERGHAVHSCIQIQANRAKSWQIVPNRAKSCFACCQVDLRGLDMEQMWDYVELSGTEACQIPAISGISGIFRDIPGYSGINNFSPGALTADELR